LDPRTLLARRHQQLHLPVQHPAAEPDRTPAKRLRLAPVIQRLGTDTHDHRPSRPHRPPDGSNLDVLSNYCPDIAPSTARSHITQNPTATGTLHATSGPINVPAPAPPTDAQSAACKPKLASLSLHERASYQPASHFWLIQTVESLIFVGLAALLVTAAILAVTRHRPT
jgi:hypothetical protein